MRYDLHAERTEDVDAAVKVYHAAATRGRVEVRITPQGRRLAKGIERAWELRQRGIDVPLDPLEEWIARRYAHECYWADGTSSPLDRLVVDLPPYCGR